MEAHKWTRGTKSTQKIPLASDTQGKRLVGPHPQEEAWTFKSQRGFHRNRKQIDQVNTTFSFLLQILVLSR